MNHDVPLLLLSVQAEAEVNRHDRSVNNMVKVVHATSRAVVNRWQKYHELCEDVSTTVSNKFMAYMSRRGHLVRRPGTVTLLVYIWLVPLLFPFLHGLVDFPFISVLHLASGRSAQAKLSPLAGACGSNRIHASLLQVRSGECSAAASSGPSNKWHAHVPLNE